MEGQKIQAEKLQSEPEIVIESDVPLSGWGVKRIEDNKYFKYVNKLEVGQSFSYPSSEANLVTNVIQWLQKHDGSRSFAIRTISSTHKRVWRKG